MFAFQNSTLIATASFLLVMVSCEKRTVSPENTFPASEVYSIYIDQDQTVWAGTAEGLISFRDNAWKIHHQIPGVPAENIRDIAYRNRESVHELWMASPTGLSVADYSLDAIGSVITYTEEEDQLPHNEVTAVAVDAINAGWAVTPSGFGIIKNGIWYQYDDFGDLSLHQINDIGPDNEGWIFACTEGLGVGRFRYDEEIDGITGASYYEDTWSGLLTDTVLSLYVVSHNEQWFGTTRGVAHHQSWETKLDWENFGVSDGLIHNRVTCIAGAGEGIIWFGTPEGASSYDGTNWISYDSNLGLIHNQINDIAIDKQGIVWFATPRGISSFDGDEWTNYQKD